MYVCKRFGIGSGAYTFNENEQIAFSANFGNAKPNSTTVIGLSGAFDNYGSSIVPTEIGNINAQIWIRGDNVAEMQQLHEDVGKMLAMGRTILEITPIDTALGTRYVYARLNAVQMPQNAANVPHRQQRVTLDFRVDYPYFLGHPDTVYWANDGWTADDGLTAISCQIDMEAVGDGDTVSITNNGNYPAPAYIRWNINGNTTNPTVYRQDVDLTTVESVQYTGSLVDGDSVEINSLDHSAKKGMTNVYSNLTVLNGNWLTIPVGTSDLLISGTFASDADLNIFFWEKWVT